MKPKTYTVYVNNQPLDSFPTKAEAFERGKELGVKFFVHDGWAVVFEDKPVEYDAELAAAVRGPWNNCD